jgi:flagellar hook-associated protein 3 FlgL
MRVADRMKYESFKMNLGDIQQRLARTQEMIASGKKVIDPSDDPVVAARSVQIGAEQQVGAQLKKNLQSLQLLDSTYESSLNAVNDLLSRAKQVAITQSSDTMDASSRKTASEEIKGIIEQLVTIGNTKVGNNFVFGGMKSGSAAFSLNTADYSVAFNGSQNVPQVFVDGSEKMNLGMSGKDVFNSGGADVFQVLKDLKEALETNNGVAIRNSLTGLDSGLNLTENNIAYIGVSSSRVETLIQNNGTNDTRLTETLSEMADADVTSVISDFNTLSTAYQSMIYTMSKMQELNIFNYLR